ncbi:hypothetical protein HNR00_003591 [Methylorubrum rhodinum]|uniref:Uncharacterized protein n=1 Tax=Methylorubrum rhodinum TaxID=29428 RepID=A0A840ZNX4_9HYPH|nr:hypothetical protein [Methylorubrum rhodinum]MBB5758864.1 hypothetical protein [Methylorubrum rhodinum]
MPFLTATQAAVAAGRTVRLAVLAYFDFADGPGRYWLYGAGPLVTGDGQTWDGTGTLAQIDGLDVPVGTTAPKATFTMSGVSARIAALARSQSANVRGRDVRVLVQFYVEATGGAIVRLDDPIEVWSGEMDVMSYDALGNGQFSVSVSAEGPWTARNKPPFGFLTDTDQQARFPGDRGLELVASLPGKAINWPV